MTKEAIKSPVTVYLSRELTLTGWRQEQRGIGHDELYVDGPLDQLPVLVLKHVQEYLLTLYTGSV
jgi:hypothetical protein